MAQSYSFVSLIVKIVSGLASISTLPAAAKTQYFTIK